MARLVIVSNRVPIPKSRGPAAGGLTVALKDALIPGTVWFGWSGRTMAQTTRTPALVEARGVLYATIDLNAAEFRHFYSEFSNRVLWPLFHFQAERLRFRREDWRGYLSVNRTLAEVLKPMLEPDDLIWIHDYHLIPMGRFLRELGVRNRIGFFLHVPFVPASVFRALPVAKELLSDFCHYDVIGFQTDEHVDDFADSLEHILGARVSGAVAQINGRRAHLMACPVGIDPTAFARMARRAMMSTEARRLEESLVGRALAIGVDRLDYSKGLPNRFEGIASLFSRHPEHLRRVSFLQIIARSREEVDDYRRLRAELDGLAGHINGRFSDVDWVPLRYGARAVGRGALAGYYRIARIGLVTPLRDGMNLVAKEFIAAQDTDDPGVLVLSRFAGAADELTEALLVNPHDPDQIADAIHLALVMSLKERRARHEVLLDKIYRTTAKTYFKCYLAALRGSAGPN